jgi:hypothetical protein
MYTIDEFTTSNLGTVFSFLPLKPFHVKRVDEDDRSY